MLRLPAQAAALRRAAADAHLICYHPPIPNSVLLQMQGKSLILICAPFKGIAGGNLGGCTASTRVHIAENMEQAAIMPDSEVVLSKGAHPHSVHASTCSVHIVHNVQRSMFVMHQTSGQVKSWVSGLRVHSMLCLTGASLRRRQG